jgi:hypothetical protein
MSVVLPRELQYASTLPSLPAGVQNMEQSLLPINGSSFSCATSGTIVQWDLPARGYAVPDSFYVKYKWALTNASETKIRGTPVYAPLQKVETIFASQTVESITNYNVVQNMLTNCTLNVAQKYGLQSAYGFKTDNNVVPSLDELDGRHCDANETGSFSAPLSCLLSNCDKMVPLGMMPTVRIQITLDSIANFCTAGIAAIVADPALGIAAAAAVTAPTDFVITDFQLCYTMIDMGPEVDSLVRGMGEKIYLKSQSFTNSGTTVLAGTTGQVAYVFSQRLASVKSLFLHNSSTSTNGIFDAYDITTAGDYQFEIAGKCYPPRPISAAGNKTGILMELKKATGSIFDKANNFSINTTEFGMVLGTASTIRAPAKCYIGCNTELLPSNGVILSGTSTQTSPIAVRVNITAATAAIATLNLICCYDALIEIYPGNKAALVIQ